MRKEDLLKVWKAYDFTSFPRMMGDPLQTAVYTQGEMFKWFRANVGKAICFTSHNSYPEMDKRYNPPRPLTIRVSNLFQDFDAKDKPENAQLDTIKLIDWCEKEGLPYVNSFSGMKGFHDYIRLLPKIYPYDDDLRMKTRAVHNWLKGELKLRTMDKMCKDPRRMCRVPYSLYVRENKHRQYIIGQTYCFPLKLEQIHDLSITEILEMARSPPLYVPVLEKPKMDLDGFIKIFDIDVEKWSQETEECETGERVNAWKHYKDVPGDDFHQLIKHVVPRPCIHNDLFSRNPTHAGRRMTVIQLKDLGYSFSEVVALFEKASIEFKWVDRMFQKRRIYQIKHIYFRVPPYQHDTCKTIKYTHGLCIGEECPKFRGW